MADSDIHIYLICRYVVVLSNVAAGVMLVLGILESTVVQLYFFDENVNS